MSYEPISLQRIFNLAWQAFIVERRPPGRGPEGCQYRTANGNRCAVGLALNDEQLDAVDDDSPLGRLVETHPEWFDHSVLALGNMATSFQYRLHDRLTLDYLTPNGNVEYIWRCSAKEMERTYREAAYVYGLTIPQPPVTQSIAGYVGYVPEHCVALSPNLA